MTWLELVNWGSVTTTGIFCAGFTLGVLVAWAAALLVYEDRRK